MALLDLGDHQFESLLDILVITCACFSPTATELFGEFLSVGIGDLSLLWRKIGFVADEDEGDFFNALVT